jgi:Ca2+-binding RTX toxin-like protein
LLFAAASLSSGEASAQCALTCQAINPGCNVVTCLGGPCFGSGANDCIVGTAGTDIIFGLGGNDCICAEGGGDTVQAGDGDDFVFGGDGADIISGDAGADNLFGEGDNDNINGGDDADFLFGGTGTDTLNGDAGNDQLFGDVGDDTLNGGPDDDTLFGEAGADTLRGDDGIDTLNGGDDDDQLFGGIGGDTLNGDAGADILRGEDGDDQLNGGTENDDLSGGPGADSLSGDSGNGDDGDDPQLDGGDGEDTINGGAGNDTANGGAGVDFISGGPDNDTLSGGDGNDIINGDDGDDNISGGPDNDTLDGGAGTDDLFGNAGNDVCLNAANMDPSCESFTHALVASFEAFTGQGSSILRWVTSSEAGTVGFRLYRALDGEWVAAHEGLLPGLLSSPQGGVYELRDTDADETETYLLVEVDTRGGQSSHGPFDVSFDRSGETMLGEAAVFARQAHALSPSQTVLKAANGEKQSGGDPVAIYLGIEETGLYSVSAAEIAARFGVAEASIENRIRAGDLSLTEQGESIAWASSADGSELQFFGVERRSLFSTERIYRLSLATGDTMAERSAAPGAITDGLTFDGELHLEEDLIPGVIIAQDPNEDYWFWQLISAEPAMPLVATVTFDAESVAGDAVLSVDLHGVEGETHTVEVRVNGTLLGTTSFDGIVAHQASFDVPESALLEGENTLTVGPAAAGPSMLYLNSADLTYERAYATEARSLLFSADVDASVEVVGLTGEDIALLDVSDPRQPVRLTDAVVNATGLQLAAQAEASYFSLAATEIRSPSSIWNDVPSDLRGDSNAADYLLIAPAALLDAAQELADHREAEGLSPMLVELQDIYDEFAFGSPDPNAIRDFLGYAHANWETAPEYVVLVGKGSFDYRDILGMGGNFMPPVMVRTKDGLFSSDTSLADFLDDDGLPDVAIGRLPVSSGEELVATIAQILDYEDSIETLRDEITLFADQTEPRSNFAMSSDSAAEGIPLDWNATAVYRSELEDLESTRALFFDEVRKGPRLVNYLGHSGLTAFGLQETLLNIEDLDSMVVDGAQPIFANMTCVSSRFAVPGLVSLGEAMLLSDEAGVAVWGPSGLSINEQATMLSRELINQLSAGDEFRLGRMINQALPAVADMEFGRDMIEIYHLFGDPALRVAKSDDGGGNGGSGGSAGSGGSGGTAGSGGTPGVNPGFRTASRCSVGWSQTGESLPLILLLVGAAALGWRRRSRRS